MIALLLAVAVVASPAPLKAHTPPHAKPTPRQSDAATRSAATTLSTFFTIFTGKPKPKPAST